MSLRLLVCGVLFSLLAIAETPKQPIPFSHKVHAGNLKLPCKMCHPNPDPGERMTIAPVSTCMQCHSAIKSDSPGLERLAAFARNNRRIPWIRVYQVPSFVIFSHRTHLETDNTCQECHGAVAERDQLKIETDLSMDGCVNCHRLKKASTDCTTCHQLEQ